MARDSPSRRRHPTDALGSSEIDGMIFQIATQGPVIPAATVFVFAANENVFNLKLDKPFNLPSGLKAFRDQNLIETPQYEKLERPTTELVKVQNSHPADDRLGCRTTEGRRNSEADSDAVYERRHRPLELKEKREGRQHREQLKRLARQLPKRVEELGNMPTSVFLKAPASWFSPAPVDQTAFAPGDEGGRRKTEMLLNASVLKNNCLRYAIPIWQLSKAAPYLPSSPSASRKHCALPCAPEAAGGSYKRKREFMDYVCVPRKKCDRKSSWVEARGGGDTLRGNPATDPSNSNEKALCPPPRGREKSKPPEDLSEEPRPPKKRTTDFTNLGDHNPIFRVVSIDADNSVLFQNPSCTDEIKFPVRVKWSLDDQAAFDLIAQKFRDILPGPGFTLPVGGDVLLAFKRIAAQMPRATTAQVLEFHYWRQNPDTFSDGQLSVPTADTL
ncbi:hypothetical protein B0H13DRAFT_550840 [Mycena leptocephala]|nr:hypothetical protein B0H13DRAFT_550840 [Mycena leptocephala]